MDHIAIMKKSWGLIPKILTGEKTVESRWYQTRRAPWDAVQKGDRIFFKNAGEKITACARVSRVLQFEIKIMQDADRIIARYGKSICLAQLAVGGVKPAKGARYSSDKVNPNVLVWGRTPKYCILVFLQDTKRVFKPFSINKKGHGAMAAWITIKNIQDIILRPPYDPLPLRHPVS